MKTAKRFHPYERNGRIIRRLRNQVDPIMSQERLAAMVGTSRRHMIRLENGEHLPSTELRNKIADVVGASRESIQAADDDDEESSMPLTRDEYTMLGALMARLGASLPEVES